MEGKSQEEHTIRKYHWWTGESKPEGKDTTRRQIRGRSKQAEGEKVEKTDVHTTEVSTYLP